MRKFFVVGQDNDGGDYGRADERLAEGEIRQDSLLEANLLHLLSGIAQKIDELNEIKDRQPAAALQIMADIVNSVAECFEGLLSVAPGEGFLAESVEKAAKCFPNVKLIHVDKNRVSAQTVINLYRGWTGDRNERNQLFTQIALGIVDVMESYFSLAAEKFNTRHMANDWKDTYTVCLNELIESVKGVSF